MAGSFGFERDKYDVSMAIGERELLPAVRRAPADCLIIADGFSCREQIAQGTPRRALHLAEVLQMALSAAVVGPGPGVLDSRPYPESARAQQREAQVLKSMKHAGLGLAALAAGGVLLWELSRRY
jgi:hypothetical protein